MVAGHSRGLWECRERLGRQAEKFAGVELQHFCVERFPFTQLDATTSWVLRLFCFETKNGSSHGDFIARFERPLLHWNSVDESAGVTIEIAQNQLAVPGCNGAVMRGNRGVIQANGAVQIPSYNQVNAERKLGIA